MKRFYLKITIIILFFCFSCQVSIKFEPEKHDSFQNRMRKMNNQFEGIYIFFEKGFSNSQIIVSLKKIIIMDTIVSTQKTSQLTLNLPLSFKLLENSKKLNCTIEGKKYIVTIQKGYQNIRISKIHGKRNISVVYDNNYKLYE
jgi:hypothetical protein